MLIKYAKITEVTEQMYYVTFLGETEQSAMVYKRVATYTPALNDMVAILEDKVGKKILIGRVI